MMNYIWSAIFLSAFLYSCISGRLADFSTALTESSADAVEFIIRLAGIMAMWSGLMEIAERSGLIRKMSRLMVPFTSCLFPHLRNQEALSAIVMSFISNLFGAGNSSTIFALRAMEKLDEENGCAPSASNDMCTFAVVNMAFAVSAAFVFGDHLGFTAGFHADMIVPVIVGKLVGGIAAVLLALRLTGALSPDTDSVPPV